MSAEAGRRHRNHCEIDDVEETERALAILQPGAVDPVDENDESDEKQGDAQLCRYVCPDRPTTGATQHPGALSASHAAWTDGALGVGIGLGLQDVIKNFVCGIVLLFDGSVEVGDYVELEGGGTGAIIAIGPRATTLRTTDHVDVLVPNAALLGGKLTNWTRERASRRVHVPFGVAYGTDKELVKMAALEVARAVSFTLPEGELHKTQVWLTGFGSSALEFELVVWPSLAAVKRPGSMFAAYMWALDDAFRKYGIEIPFSQHDLRIRTFFGREDDAAIEALSSPICRVKQRKSVERPSANDAADDIVEATDG